VVRRGETLELSDPECWYLDPADPEHIQRVFQQVGPLDRVLYAWSADAAPPEALDAATLRDAQQDGCRGLLHVVQALARTERTGAPPQLWILTRGVQPIAVAGGSVRVNPAQAPVWGLGRTIAQEHPEIWGGMIDLDPDHAPDDVDHLLTEITDPDEEDHLAYRGGERYIARLVADATARPMSWLHFRSDATYLITGGAGGLGHTVARWMIEQGARHLVLAGRTPISPDIRMLLEALERRGAFTATYEEADVSEESDVARVLERIEDTKRPLRGIVHAAGVLADATLLQQSWPRFLDVMAPKVFGTWHLHRLTSALPLDHFVCFSSSASILGAAGQGNYAAANSFMDALAHYRHDLGRPALCINWGPWDQVGMSAALDPRARVQRANQGIHALAPARALRLLESAVQQSRPQIGILSVDWHTLLKGAAPILRRSSVFKDLAAAVSTAALEPVGARHPVLDRFAIGAPEERRSLAHDYVLEQVTRLLGAEAHHLDPHEALTLQGFDSLMALELREQVDADLQISMPILTFFRSNSISALSTYVLGELEKRYAGEQAHAPQELSPAELLARLNDLSDEDVDRALRWELER
jgi:hypothetical protein